jgi:hypothetical protein
MKTSDSRVLLSPPSLIAALRAGFDAIANHIALILIPIALDLYLWLGPHLRLKQLIESVVSQLIALYSLQDPGASEMLQVINNLWLQIAAQFNLFIALRSYPVGVPSLLASASPVESPVGVPVMWEISALVSALLAWGLITMVGLGAGTLFFEIVSQVVLRGAVDWPQTWIQLPEKILRVLFLTLFWASVLIGVSIPGSFIISVGSLGGQFFAQCALFVYAGLLIWLFYHLLFSPHGIFVYGYKALKSIRTSFELVRATWLATSLFFLAIFVISTLLDRLWHAPPVTSWLTLVGVVGHAFVTTGLLASSFAYYRDANHWVKSRSQRDNQFQQRYET